MKIHSRIEERIIKKLATTNLLHKEIDQLKRKKSRLKMYGETWDKLDKKITKLVLQSSKMVTEAGRIYLGSLISGKGEISHAQK